MVLAPIRRFLIKRPILANGILFGGLFAASDVTVQIFIHKKEKYDWKSTARVAFVTACFYGPVYPYYYKWLDRVLPGTNPVTLFKKIIFDQGVMGLVGSVYFFGAVSLLEDKGNVWKEVSEKAPKAYLIGFVYWPLAQIINFKYMPTHLKPAYVAVGAFVWSNFLCYLKQKRSESHHETEKKNLI